MSDSIRGASSENVLTLMLWNDRQAPHLGQMLTANLFGDRNQEIVAEAALNYIAFYGKAPKHHIKDLLESTLRRPGGQSNLLMQLIDQTESIKDEIDADYVMSELDKFIRIRNRRLAMTEASALLDQGDEASADEVLWKRTGVAVTSALSPGIYLHDSSLDFMTANEKEDQFSTGIAALDARGLMLTRKTQTMFIAPRKAGKSWCCINIGKAAITSRHSVLHITLENSEELTKRRYCQAMWSMTKRQALDTVSMPYFVRDENGKWVDTQYKQDRIPIALTMDNQRYIKERLESMHMRPPLLIKQFPTNTMSIARYNTFLDYLERQHKFVPDLVIVDYPDLMAIDSRNLRVDTGRTFAALRGVAVDRNHALFCPTQGNRESMDARVVTSKMVSEDWSKVGTADTVLTFCRTKHEKDKGLARIWVDAARDEEDGFGVMITQAYSIGQFCLDSVLMDQKVIEASDKIIDGSKATANVADEQSED